MDEKASRLHDIFMNQDRCLMCLDSPIPRPIPKDALEALPPWRAVMMARIAVNVGVMSQTDCDIVVSAASEATGSGSLIGRLTKLS